MDIPSSIKRYFKITNAEEKHNGFQYVDGLNILDKPFEEEGSCVKGGLYFSDAEHILEFISFGIYLREITFPESDPEFKMVKDPQEDKWRANKLILGKKYNLCDVSTFKFLISLGANIKVNEYEMEQWAIKHNFLEIIKFFIKEGIYLEDYDQLETAARYGQFEIVKFFYEKLSAQSNYDDLEKIIDRGFQLACEYGHLEITKFLVEKGANFEKNEKYAIRWATEGGHLDVVKFLVEHRVSQCDTQARPARILCNAQNRDKVEKGADYCYNGDQALQIAVRRGHLEIVKFLVGKGADIASVYDKALSWAQYYKHADMVKYLIEIAPSNHKS